MCTEFHTQDKTCPPNKRRALALCLNSAIFVLSTLGIILACVRATADGYSHWYKRLLYFTQMSNLWVACLSLFLVLYTLRETLTGRPVPRILYPLQYISTVSITLTGIIFCGLLAPFADFPIWTFSSILTHAVVPPLSIAAFFLCEQPYPLLRRHVYLTVTPPLGYFILCAVLFFLRVDFGKGDPYPYFFMNLRSEVGWLGARWGGDRPELGTLWWLLLILALILGIAALYRALHPDERRRKREKLLT